MQTKGKGAKAEKARVGKSQSRAAPRQGQERLRPGGLERLVLAYMKKHKGKLPMSPRAVAHGLKRSSGAVGNCLGRLERAGKVRLVEKKPRRYDLAAARRST